MMKHTLAIASAVLLIALLTFTTGTASAEDAVSTSLNCAAQDSNYVDKYLGKFTLTEPIRGQAYLNKYTEDAGTGLSAGNYMSKYMEGAQYFDSRCTRVSSEDTTSEPTALLLQQTPPAVVAPAASAPGGIAAPAAAGIPIAAATQSQPPSILRSCIDKRAKKAHCNGLITDAEFEQLKAFEAALDESKGQLVNASPAAGVTDGMTLLSVEDTSSSLNNGQLNALNNKVNNLIKNSQRSKVWSKKFRAFNNGRRSLRGFTTSRYGHTGGGRF